MQRPYAPELEESSKFRIDLAWTDNATNEFGYAVERCAGTGCSNFVEIGRTGEDGSGFRNTPAVRPTSISPSSVETIVVRR